MRTEESKERNAPERLLLRELRSPQNARFLRAMPAFRMDADIPASMANLLDRLDEAEDMRGDRRSGNRGEDPGATRPVRGAIHAPSSR